MSGFHTLHLHPWSRSWLKRRYLKVDMNNAPCQGLVVNNAILYEVKTFILSVTSHRAFSELTLVATKLPQLVIFRVLIGPGGVHVAP